MTANMEEGYSFNRDKLQYSDKSVIYMGVFLRQWGHFITILISRLWYAVTSGRDDLYIAYCTWKEGALWGEMPEEQLTGNYLGVLELLGFPEERLIEVKQPTQFKEVIVPEWGYLSERYYSDEYKRLCDYIRDAVPGEGEAYPKVYFTRCGNEDSGDRDFGEEKIVELFRNNGYRIIEPQAYSTKEQIRIIKNCRSLACISGSLTHNVVFARDGIHMVVLNRQARPMVSHQFQGPINQMRQANALHIDVSLRLLPAVSVGPNLFYISPELERYIADNHFQYKKKDDNKRNLRKHLVLVWYFLNWLDSYREAQGISRLWQQFTQFSMEQYEYYRNELKWFDNEGSKRWRKKLYKISSSIW